MTRAVWRITGTVLLVLWGAARLAGQATAADPYNLPMVQAACGAESGTPPSAMSGGHVENTPLRAGMARVYVITETWGFLGSQGKPVRLGMDGKWFGANRSYTYGYGFVDVSPGVHHLCVAASVKGVLPDTSAGVVLARVEAAAGHTYFFYNRYIHLAHILTLSPISVEDGTMYLEALPSSKVPKLWNTAAAQAACGADPDKMPAGLPPPPNLPGSPAEGRALVYFFSGVPQFSGHSWLERALDLVVPIHVAADGKWLGETELRSYIGVQMAPGNHRVCTASRLILGMKPTLHVGKLDVVAGKTYFVDTDTLRPVDRGLALVWLRRIAAMPKSETPDLKALKQWSETNFPASPEELRACGIPDPNNKAEAPPPAPETDGAAPISQVFFLLRSDIKRLNRQHTVDAGVDGRWVASLRSTSWASFPVTAGQHNVCVNIGNGPGPRATQWFSPDSILFLDSFDAEDHAPIYFESQVVVIKLEYSDIDEFSSYRLDPDEGALLVASYLRSDPLHPLP